MRELHTPYDVDNFSSQDDLMKQFNAQGRDQANVVEDQALRVQRLVEDQAIKALVLDQFNPIQLDSKINSVQDQCISIKQ